MRNFTLTVCIFLVCSLYALAQPVREVRAVWLTTNYNAKDWPKTSIASAQKTSLTTILDKLRDANFNTVLFQVQVYGDVIWDSSFQPWMKIFSGQYGVAPSYNVCDFVIEECHKRGMEVHAWIVPYRLGSKVNADGYESAASNHRHVIYTNPELCKIYNNQYYLDPGLPATREYLLNVYEELVKKHDFDGINLDYTRYPAKDFPDSETYSLYNPEKLSLADWRRENINQFVSELYDMIKAYKPAMKLGAAPIGTYKNLPGKGNFEAYGDVYQDACEWMKRGKHDLLIPQMYWDESAGFSPNMDTWLSNCNNRQLAIGLAPYKMEESPYWQPSVITNQIDISRSKGADGVCFFRTDYITGSSTRVKELYNNLKNNQFRFPAHIPVMDYNGITKPGMPLNPVYSVSEGNMYHITWTNPESDALRYYTVYAQKGNKVDITNPENLIAKVTDRTTFDFKAPDDSPYSFAITAVDRGNYESDAALATDNGQVSLEKLLISKWILTDRKFTIECNKEINLISVFSINGNLTQSKRFRNNKATMKIHHLPKGVYVFVINFSDGSAERFKIIL